LLVPNADEIAPVFDDRPIGLLHQQDVDCRAPAGDGAVYPESNDEADGG
jgi:hypothetical protein